MALTVETFSISFFSLLLLPGLTAAKTSAAIPPSKSLSISVQGAVPKFNVSEVSPGCSLNRILVALKDAKYVNV